MKLLSRMKKKEEEEGEESEGVQLTKKKKSDGSAMKQRWLWRGCQKTEARERRSRDDRAWR